MSDSASRALREATVAAELSARWAETETRVHYVPEYSDWPGRQKRLEERGIHEVDQGVHDEISVEAIMMTVDPATVRMEQRLASGSFSINGVDLAQAERAIALGRDLVDHIATETANAEQIQDAAASGPSRTKAGCQPPSIKVLRNPMAYSIDVTKSGKCSMSTHSSWYRITDL